MEFSKVRSVAEDAARHVGARMREILCNAEAVDIQHKGITDLVTEVDIWAEQQIKSYISESFPEHTLIGEETSSELVKTSGRSLSEISRDGVCWIIDPIDGTTNFANRIPHSVISIGVLQDGMRTFGLVFDPYRDELFTAVRGKGAFLNDRPISVSEKTSLISSVVATSFPHDNMERWEYYRHVHDTVVKSCRKVRVFGAAALEQCWVACGRLDAFLAYNLQPWDIAAGALIVTEAGGKVGCFVDPNYEDVTFSASLLVAGEGIFDTLFNLTHQADAVAQQENLS